MSLQVETISGYTDNMADFENLLNDFISSHSIIYPIDYKSVSPQNDAPQIIALVTYETNNEQWQDIFNQVKDYDYNELLTAVLKLSNVNFSTDTIGNIVTRYTDPTESITSDLAKLHDVQIEFDKDLDGEV
ncbi:MULTISPECIES: hypothetical protein [Staphylococcus]|uniref:hypothetical protein n=1 Tax=Staphylococcus TaxID=1279 RepID=UPI000267DC7D|nr:MULTISPECIES: hypothetical protein [Staphylococcus]EJX17493.1 hypothetical protein SOJ_17820 [Staphylococcus sp. OJ82]MDK9867826.1 hypothetical protein [Staphylococcus equorum]OIS50216.1 hypothetical protein A4A29_02350 [Staphylococcus equorum]CCI60660.1 putative uncharacterized protein [Staphylococcus equorum subsp. equorum Mu2]